jgi:hypothetical protein
VLDAQHFGDSGFEFSHLKSVSFIYFTAEPAEIFLKKFFLCALCVSAVSSSYWHLFSPFKYLLTVYFKLARNLQDISGLLRGSSFFAHFTGHLNERFNQPGIGGCPLTVGQI